MALDSNINRIKFQRSTTAGAKPTDLAMGEIGINLTDRTLYSFDGTNIVDIGFGLGGTVKGDITSTKNIRANGTVKADFGVVGKTIGVGGTAGTGEGLSLFNSDTYTTGLPSYGMSFAKAASFGTHGAMPNNDWAVYFTSNSVSNNRGWIFKNYNPAQPNQGNVASIDANGVATFAKVVAPIQGNADTATRLKNDITINGIPFTGEVSVNNVPGWRSIQAVDDRTLKPNTSPKQSMSTYFTTKGGMNGVADSVYGDLLVMNTWTEPSGGNVNGVFFPKNTDGNPLLYKAPIGSSTWGAPREFAMMDSTVARSKRFQFSQSIETGNIAQWYRIGKGTIPQMGTVVEFEITGGAGFNAQHVQMTPTKLIIKTGNGSPVGSAAIKMIIMDGNNSPVNACVRHIGNNVQEVWINLGEYFTAYVNVLMPENVTDWVNEWVAGGTADPINATFAGIERIARADVSNAASATKLQTARNINNVPFDGTKDIDIQPKSFRLEVNTDLNTVLSEGFYYCDYDIEANTMKNKPFEGSFSLEVLRTAGVIQRYTHYNTGRTWIRKSYVGFSDWHEIALQDHENIFTRQQFIDAGVSSVLNIHSSGESAIVFYKPARRIVQTLADDNSFGWHSGNGWLLRSRNDNELTINVNAFVPDSKTLIWQGAEGDNIGRVQNGNGAITIDSPEQGMASIRNAMQFNWYNDAFQIGAIRSGSQASHGLGITLGNNNLLARFTTDGSLYAKKDIFARNGSLYAQEGGVDVKWESTANSHISRSGRFAGPTAQYHYIDVGVDGRDMMTFASYGGNYQWVNPASNEILMSFSLTGGLQLNRQIHLTGVSPSDTIQSLGVHRGELNVQGTKPDSWSTGYMPIAHATLQSDSGFRQHAVFGAYKATNDWQAGGAFIAHGGETDANPTHSFYFGKDTRGGGFFQHSSGAIRTDAQFIAHNNLHVGGELHVAGMIKSASPYISFLKPDGSERAVAVGALLASDSYADFVNVPSTGIYSKGQIRSLSGFCMPYAPGGDINGFWPGNGDGASYNTCNIDIQSWYGLGFKGNDGVRRIVFDLRNGIGNFQNSVNAPIFNGKATEVAVNYNSNVGAALKAAWQGAVFYNAGCTAYVIDGNTLRLENIPLRSLGRFIEPGKSKVHIDTGHGTALRTGIITSNVVTSDTSFYIIVNMPNHGIGNGLGMGIRAITYSGFGGSFAGALQNNDNFRYTWKLNLDSACYSWPSINVTTSTEWDGRWGPKGAAGLVGCGTAYDKSTVMFMVTDNNTDNNAMTSDYVSVQVWDVVG